MNVLTARCAKFREWLVTLSGRYLLVHERKWLEQKLRELGGHQLLHISASDSLFSRKSVAFNKVSLIFSAPHKQAQHAVILGDVDAWPIATESINVLMLHHILDFAQAPHAFLREASRVLTPGGYIVCCGFNPWSLLGVKRFFNLSIREGNYISAHRLKDWFKLLGFDVRDEQYLFFSSRYRRLERALQHYNLPIGGVYLIALRKSVQSVTPVVSLWKKQKAPLVAISSFSRAQLQKPSHDT